MTSQMQELLARDIAQTFVRERINNILAGDAVAAKDYPSAVSESQKMIAAGEAKSNELKLLEQLQQGRELQ